jgi:hypothetical protein
VTLLSISSGYLRVCRVGTPAAVLTSAPPSPAASSTQPETTTTSSARQQRTATSAQLNRPDTDSTELHVGMCHETIGVFHDTQPGGPTAAHCQHASHRLRSSQGELLRKFMGSTECMQDCLLQGKAVKSGWTTSNSHSNSNKYAGVDSICSRIARLTSAAAW